MAASPDFSTDSPAAPAARPVLPRVGASLTAGWHWDTWEYRALQLGMLLSGALLLVTVISVPLDLWEQVVFGVLCFACAVLLNRSPGRLVTLLLTFISLTVSSRYLYWRMTETLQMDDGFDLFFGSGLIAAEIYAWLVLVLGFFRPSGRWSAARWR